MKVYATHMGLDEWVIAAPDQKEALQAWGVQENLFAQGAAPVRHRARRGRQSVREVMLSVTTAYLGDSMKRQTGFHFYALGLFILLITGTLDTVTAQQTGNADYPAKARKAAAEGTLIFSVDVDDQGNLRNIRFVRFENMNTDDPEILEEFKTAVLNLLQNAKVKPATDHGVPVEQKGFLVKISFRCKVGDRNNCG